MTDPASGFSHCVTALINAPARLAFEYLSDPIALGEWSIGCMNTAPAEQPDLYTGRSLFDGAQNWFAIDAHPEMLMIDYRIGRPGRLVPHISARVIPPEVCDLASDQCYVTLIAWRISSMTPERWQALCAAHELEIWLIKSQLEHRMKADLASIR